ncbi:MAG: peptidylprolyl isomerase [Companilactobacillus sp.]|jgi:foldase protein PrsA|uniref:peptidylprolyl isomerase PrsA n=1 Tax=Companilactobacillus sp. TaxID=2767905 RepID=UPI0025C1A3EB|nr:peptidylprolyl isomerase PrsA [Companilactobacillus sp.]MCH4007963.1 peptidylprolyl isomerase [Companilactobacillus sp.]MCH4051858.1 peptidylprolyl isomerase [Companilactobacillus sp.]MCH4075906.1 peptidylprolyl isomerase [Companilactobacillus sp.]MCH4124481.1 peptidylprolyl isomerase [Companilactobacillus sp.]MCH4132556.1 peptidylprolyl isomerase [Companilactobacillus sp.]
MNKRLTRWILAIAGLLLVTVVAGCSGNKTVATLKGGRITQNDYYKEMKNSSAGKQQLQTMIISKALENQYGKKVSSKQVDKEYNKYKSQYGSSFSSILQQNGMTTAQFKKNIRTNLLTKVALEDNKKVTNADLKKQWKTYSPKITVSQILVAKKATAQEVIDKLNDGGDFTKLAKQYSTDSATKNKGGKMTPFDSDSSSVDTSLKSAAFKLKKAGDISTEPVKTQYGYSVIKLDKKPAKGKMSDHTAELKSKIYAGWMQDSTVMQSVISKVLKKADVSIKDDDLKDVLAGYVSNTSSKSSSSSSK